MLLKFLSPESASCEIRWPINLSGYHCRILFDTKEPLHRSHAGAIQFLPLMNRKCFYAAISRYSSGRSSNSLLHSSEQKKYFFPANWVPNSDSLSSTVVPQTGSVVMIPPAAGDFVPLVST